MAELKQCKTCGTEKPLNEYYKTGKYYISNCKPCHKKECVVANRKYGKTEKGKAAIKRWGTKYKGVYGIFSNETCLYVGESKWLNRRISIHKSRIKNPNIAERPNLREMYIRIGRYATTEIRVLEETDNHKEREEYWINKLQPKYNSYV